MRRRLTTLLSDVSRVASPTSCPDGLEVLRRLRAEPGSHGDVPVVMFSAVHHPRLAAEAGRLGAADWVVKGGVGPDELLARLARHLPPQSTNMGPTAPPVDKPRDS